METFKWMNVSVKISTDFHEFPMYYFRAIQPDTYIYANEISLNFIYIRFIEHNSTSCMRKTHYRIGEKKKK